MAKQTRPACRKVVPKDSSSEGNGPEEGEAVRRQLRRATETEEKSDAKKKEKNQNVPKSNQISFLRII